VREDLIDHGALRNARDDAHGPGTARARERVHLVDLPQQLGPPALRLRAREALGRRHGDRGPRLRRWAAATRRCGRPLPPRDSNSYRFDAVDGAIREIEAVPERKRPIPRFVVGCAGFPDGVYSRRLPARWLASLPAQRQHVERNLRNHRATVRPELNHATLRYYIYVRRPERSEKARHVVLRGKAFQRGKR